MGIKPMAGRSMSVFRGDEAAYFVQWINGCWNALTLEQQKTATMECRPRENEDFAMIGFNWDESPAYGQGTEQKAGK
jgi:hypothetical protein